ncbi:hypothetical protein ES703_32937 [subsurface metagenome]
MGNGKETEISIIPSRLHSLLTDVNTPHLLAELEAAVCSETEADTIAAALIATHAGLFTGLHGLTKLIKPDDQIVNNSEILVNDEDLLLPVGANDIWFLWVQLRHISATATPSLDYAFTVPGGGAIEISAFWHVASRDLPADGTNERDTDCQNTEQITNFYGLYIGGGNAGNLQLQWAQHTATVENTIMKENAYMVCLRLA